MRRIDQGAACAGCGEAGPWLMGVAMAVAMTVDGGGSCGTMRRMLYYNITRVYQQFQAAYGLPIAIAMAAARNGNGSDTAARNQTKRAGMNGISHSISRWKANSAQAIT